MTDLMGLMKQAREMQKKLAEAQEQLDREEVTGESGAGLVSVRMSARGEVKALKLDPSIMVPSEAEVVEDLIIAAMSDARRKADEVQKRVMKDAAGDLPMPPGMSLPGM
ncbi:MAG: YbaB/EbfC family nucleoid-associated protein [Maricaulis sp.]|jgi:DNA-binding YbaB/EbfC family protein|nr:YbaB/EbfC family nucleoid-associated protein [Maricaulis sp.]HAQ33985.1 YbaB/EbfC family nucleoid-associated protein [Alphaproteobacteria bacterium]